MIKKLSLYNFQIHEKFIIEFDKSLNCILGQNDSGKSSIIRALYWVFYNSPSGDWMRRINDQGKMEETVVKIVFDDGTIIKRIKGDGKNRYIVDDETYDNFGYGVPQPVLEKIKINSFKTNKDEFNIHVAMQDDQSFLVHEPSTVKASVLDVLTGVSIVQRAISEFGSEIKKTKQDMINYENREQDIQKSLEKTKNLDELKIKIIELKEKDKKREELKKEIYDLQKLKFQININTSVIKGLEYIDKIEIEDVRINIEKLKLLGGGIKILISLKDKRKIVKDKIKEFKDIDLIELKNKIKQLDDSKIFIKNLTKTFKSYENNIGVVQFLDKEIKSIEKELVEFKKINKVCPLCERIW